MHQEITTNQVDYLNKFSHIFHNGSKHQIIFLHIKPAQFCQPGKKLDKNGVKKKIRNTVNKKLVKKY